MIYWKTFYKLRAKLYLDVVKDIDFYANGQWQNKKTNEHIKKKILDERESEIHYD
jgi:hypothetical protein